MTCQTSIPVINFSDWRKIKEGQTFDLYINPDNQGKKTELPTFAIVYRELNIAETFANSYLAALSLFEGSERMASEGKTMVSTEKVDTRLN